MKHQKDTKETVTEYSLLVLAVILLICGVILSFQDKTASATATYGTGILCLIFSSLSLFKSFKGLGVEAVLKEKIEEADELLAQLRAFSLPTAKLLLSNVARLGRWGSIPTREEKYNLCNEISDSLRKIGIPESDINDAKKDIYRFDLFDMAAPVFEDMNKLVQSKIQSFQDQINATSQPIHPEDNDKHKSIIESKNQVDEWRKKFDDLCQQENLFFLGDEIEQAIRECPFLNYSEKDAFLLKHNETIEDLKHYGKSRNFRRLDVWLSGDK